MTVLLGEGVTYQVNTTVTNTSTKAGTPTAAVLNIQVSGTLNGVSILENVGDYNFAASEAQSAVFPMTIPSGTGGQTGEVKVTVRDPSGNILDSASLGLEVATPVLAPFAYSAVTCSIGASGVGAWPGVFFNARVTNPGSTLVTQTLTLHRRDWVPWYIEPPGYWDWGWTEWAVARTNIGGFMEEAITLKPGQSLDIEYPPPGEYALIPADSGIMTELYLSDSGGGESVHCTAT